MRSTSWIVPLASLLVACAPDGTGPSGPARLGDPGASAITYGRLDNNDHPFVGLMVAQDASGNALWRCSGTLMSPTLFLTAGHCTEAPAAHVEIWFDADVDAGIPGNGYPNNGQVGGTPYTHPQYNPNAFYRYDLGVVVLDQPYVTGSYGALPALDVLDQLATQRGLQNVTFTSVGYGLQYINPQFVSSARVRMAATPHLVGINTGYTGDFSIRLSNNAATGGTCFGDSGGPNFIGSTNVVGGVTSYGNNWCTGGGGVYRVDRSDDLAWLALFGLTP
jgi:Trypsin